MGGGDITPELRLEALNLNRESNRIGCIRTMAKITARAKEKRLQRITDALGRCVLSSQPQISLETGPLSLFDGNTSIDIVESTEKSILGFKRRKFSPDLVAKALDGMGNLKETGGCECDTQFRTDLCQFCVRERMFRVCL